MRAFQIVVFAMGLVAFAISAVKTGQALGDTFWKTGMAIMLADLVVILLWPTPRNSQAN